MNTQPVNQSKLTQPMRNEPVSRLWKRTAPAVEAADSLRLLVLNLMRRVRALERSKGNVLSGLHPFKIYQLPPWYRQTDDQTAPNYSDSTDWLKWRIRAGSITLVSLDNAEPVAQTSALINVGGTDGAVNPDIETYLDNPSALDILIPAGCPVFYFWVTLAIDPESGIATAQLYYGTSPDQASPTADTWPSFPQPDATHQLIGYADTLTFQSDRQALIRQIARADLVFIETNSFSICDPVSGKTLGNSAVMGGKPQ